MEFVHWKNGVNVATFGYDGDGRMVSASVSGDTTYYVGGYFEWQTGASGPAAVKYYSAGSNRVAMRQAGVVTYLFGDHLNSTSVAYDDAADTTRRQGYTAFGTERYSLGGDLPTRYQFTGQRGFEEIGLQYYGARWYDGALGRFAQADTVIPEPGNPMAWDRFAYSRNSPTMYIDPTGHAYCASHVPGAMCMNDNPDPVWYTPPEPSSQQDTPTTETYIGPSPAPGSTISNNPKSDELTFTPFWENESATGQGLHVDIGTIIAILGFNISFDLVHNNLTNEDTLVITPALLFGIGEGASGSGGYVVVYNALENSDLEGGTAGVQVTLIPAVGISGSYSRSFGTGKVPEFWSGNIGVIEEISAVGFVGYSFTIKLKR